MNTTSASSIQQNTSRIIGNGNTEDLEKTVTTNNIPEPQNGSTTPGSSKVSQNLQKNAEDEDLNRRSPMLHDGGDDLDTSFVFGIAQHNSVS